MSYFSKSEEETQSAHQRMHDALVQALGVYIKRDVNGKPLSYSDKFGAEGNVIHHLFRGHEHGEGHADRILDDYLGRHKLGYPVKCKFSEEYRDWLRKERSHGTTAPALSLRARLLRVA